MSYTIIRTTELDVGGKVVEHDILFKNEQGDYYQPKFRSLEDAKANTPKGCRNVMYIRIDED